MVTRRIAQPTQDNGLPPHVVARREEHAGLTPGDPCRIDGDRDGRYTFRYADTYENGNVAVVLWGGSRGRFNFHIVGDDRVLPEPTGSRRRSGAKEGRQVEPTDGGILGRRKALGWSRKQLGARSGVSEAAIATLEAGKAPRDKSAASRIEAALQEAEGAESALLATEDAKQDILDEAILGGHPDELAALGYEDEDE